MRHGPCTCPLEASQLASCWFNSSATAHAVHHRYILPPSISTYYYLLLLHCAIPISKEIQVER